MARSPARVLRIYLATTRVLASYLWLRAQRPFLLPARYERRLLDRHARNARRIERAIVSAGGLFIKVGQMISILSNFLPEEFRRELEGLQDRLPPRPYAEIAARIESELGAPPDELFATFDRTSARHGVARPGPCGHAGRRPRRGRQGAARRHRASSAARPAAHPPPAPGDPVVHRCARARGVSSGDQPDDRRGARFHRRGAQHRAHRDALRWRPDVRLPTVVAARSSTRVLTTEFIQGTKVTNFAALASAAHDRRSLAERVVTAYCRMIFVDGVYHADPHPGNILVAADGAIVFIDFGAVGVLSPAMREGVTSFVEGVLKRDVEAIAAAMRTMGFVARDARSEDVARRVVDYVQQRFLDQVATGDWNLGDIQMDLRTKLDMMSDLKKLDVSFRQITASFQVPKDWVLLERTLLLLVGLCTELDPSWNPMTVIRPYLENAVLGQDRDWTEILRGSFKDIALRAASLPEALQQLLARANRDELVVRVPEIASAARLLYAAAHQLLYGILGTSACVLAYQAYDRGHIVLTWVLGAASVACFASLLVPLSSSRRPSGPDSIRRYQFPISIAVHCGSRGLFNTMPATLATLIAVEEISPALG